MLTYRRPSGVRMFALVFAVVVGFAIVIGAMLSAAQAAPLGGLKQFRVPTAGADPLHITPGSDGNLWFTEGDVNSPNPATINVGRITPAGDITEFPVCLDGCLPNDIVQGPGDVLYFTQNDPGLGRITTSGEVLPDVAPVDDQGNPITNAIGNGIAAHGDDVWFTDFNNYSIWRYHVTADGGRFTEFPLPTPGANAFDVAVASNGTVWFTEANARAIGRLDPVTDTFTETPVPVGIPRQIAIASDGKVWFTERFSRAVGRLDPSTDQVTEFPTPGVGPEDIAATADGALWFTQSVTGNIARISPNADGTITFSEGRSVKGSEPFGITIGPDGNPWYTMLSANKIATLQLR
jgi:virginiamycin B lyase